MKKLILILLLVPSLSWATRYYVSPTGDDKNTGTSTNQAWKTLAKVNTVTFVKGDFISFAAGGVWRETLNIRQSGADGEPITWGRYGKGPNPVLSGFTVLSGWTNNKNGTWSIMDATLGATVNMIAINGSRQAIGRYPKKGYSTYSAHWANSAIVDLGLANTRSFIGGEVVIRKNPYVTDRALVTGQSMGIISYTPFTGATQFDPTDGFGYFFQNSLACLNAFGDWCYNATTHTITMYFGAANPSSYTIEASKLNYCVNYINNGQTYNSFYNITFTGANFDAIHTTYSDNHYTTITKCQIYNIGVNGINFLSSKNLNVSNTSIKYVNNSGILNYRAANSVIYADTLDHIGDIAGMSQSGQHQALGINFNNNAPGNDNINIYGNVIKNVGYIPISIIGKNLNIYNNLIDTFCFVKQDGGGIYTFGTNNFNTRIYNNLIMHGLGAPAGTRSNANYAMGIYMDEESNNEFIYNNTIAYCGRGIMLNYANKITMRQNKIYFCDDGLFVQTKRDLPVTGITFIGNTIFGNKEQQLVTLVSLSTVDLIKNIGVMNNNVYSRPSNENNAFKVKAGRTTNYSLPQWKSAFTNFDQHSTGTPKAYKNNNTKYFIYNSPLKNVSQKADGTYQEVSGAFSFNAGQSMKVPLFNGAIMMKVGSAPIKAKIKSR